MLVAIFVLVVVLVLSQAALWAILYQLVKQQGRLLLRLDALDQRGVPGGVEADPASATSNGASGGARAGPAVAQLRPSGGLTVGAPLAPFRLPDLTGRSVASEDFPGQRLFLVHWSPQCGFCTLLAPTLTGLRSDLERARVQVVLISHGTPEVNRRFAEEHRLKFPVLLVDGAATSAPFQNQGTPVAYLLDEQGRVAHPLVVGSDQVGELASKLAADLPKKLPGERPLSASHLERDGIKPGTPAPPFRLAAVSGGEVSLEDYRGRRVLLVFSDPHCGPCNELAPKLARRYGELKSRGLDLLLIGRGDLSENRQKAEEFGVPFPVAVQQRWEISTKYGIFATPVAFLIDETGIISRGVATGPEEILALASEAIPA